MQLIPAIDLKDGRCVRLLRGDFANQTSYQAQPLDLVREYRACGADWLHVVDLDRARDGTARGNRELIAQLAGEPGIRLQVGGGLRRRVDVAQALATGAARAVIGSTAVSDPDAVKSWLESFGCERIVLALDVRLDSGTPCIATHGWQRQSSLALWDAVAGFEDAGLKHVLCTDVGRDGALAGPNVALYGEAIRRFPQIVWQASGGIRDSADLQALAACGAGAAISGKALLENLIPLEELRPFLPNA